ncbi:MAG: ELM1/GtrOC1 family putative glycosyltransferase [Candidatus Poribacteria bacterium]|nr:ELM1/GtrOC1 family putative glycosyltransferase [Candidatus Poribacteria bacterium]
MQAIVLSDGKPGHYNQSLGIIQRIPECNYHWVNVHFRSKRRDNFLRVFMRLFGGFKLPHWLIRACLRMAFRQVTIDAIFAIHQANLVLSTGSSVAAPNLLVGQLLNAKTVTCRRPSPVGIAYFDLAILPKMYWPRRDKKNVCKTTGVPNQICPANLNAQCHQLQRDLKLSDQRRVGVLVGGEDRYDTLTEKTAADFIETLTRFAANSDTQILLTTSRRTPIAVENLIAERLSDAQLCPILVLAHRENPLIDPVRTIFALSDLIVVTEDSFSMVCEAASSGKRAIILAVDHKTRRRPRRCRVYPEIMRRASVTWSGVEDLEISLQKALADKTPIEPLQDTQIAAAAVTELLSKQSSV